VSELPESLITALRASRHLFVLTGAGASAESGVPTFRDAQTGLWARYDPMTLATPEAFDRDAALVWRWYRWRRELIAHANPNPGHYALVELETRLERFTLVTQNVDGLHQRAGSRGVIEYHGSLVDTRCESCREYDDPDDADVPRCSACGGRLRPDVVWFGETIPEAAADAASRAASECNLMLCVGTSSQVYPAAGLSELAKARGAVTVEINPEPTSAPWFDHVLRGPSSLILPKLAESISNNR